jgi:phage terminase large subunit-like protein
MARRSDPVIAYARRVISGRIVAGPHVRNACRRHLDDLQHGRERGLYWDLEAALDAINFFPAVLRLAGGQFEGRPFVLDTSQEFIIGSIFGWKRADGTRRFRRAFIEEGKGNGKSPLAAGIGLYCLIADGEKRAEVYAAASKKDQAFIMFRDATAMYQQSPGLQERLTASGVNPIYNLSDLRTGSFFRPIASAQRTQEGGVSGGQSGPRPSCALCDEIHEHRDGTVIEMLERGFKWRQQPLLVMITNSGSDRNSVCWQEHQFAIKAAAGEMDPARTDSSFSYVCALDDGEDPLRDPRCWVKANPLLGDPKKGKILTREYLSEVVGQAIAIPGKLNNILRLHFCVWTDAERAWMPRGTLEKCILPFETPAAMRAEISKHEGKEVSVGVDLSASQDLTAEAFAVKTGSVQVERKEPDGSTSMVLAPTFDAWIEAWSPADSLADRSVRDSAPYDLWAKMGWLNAPAGMQIRLDYPAAFLADAATRFKVRLVAYDRYAFRRFEEELETFNFTAPLIEHPQGGKKRGAIPIELAQTAKRQHQELPQGLWMPGSVLELESMILEERIRLFGNPVLISACMAAVFEQDPIGNRWLSKRRATGRIDALVALVMAIGAATMQTPKKSDISGFLRNAVVA